MTTETTKPKRRNRRNTTKLLDEVELIEGRIRVLEAAMDKDPANVTLLQERFKLNMALRDTIRLGALIRPAYE